MDTTVRQARPSEAAVLSDLARCAKAHWGYPDAWLEQWRDALTITPERLERGLSLVAVSDDTISGVCVLELRGNRASVEHLWVRPGFLRRGIGRILLTHALANAQRVGVSRVVIESDPFAEPFYLRLGARRVGAVPAPMPGSSERVLPLLEFDVCG